MKHTEQKIKSISPRTKRVGFTCNKKQRPTIKLKKKKFKLSIIS